MTSWGGQGHEQEEATWRVKGLTLRLTCTPYVCRWRFKNKQAKLAWLGESRPAWESPGGCLAQSEPSEALGQDPGQL